MAVPTDDKKVRERLRAYGEPITLFGEGVSYPGVSNQLDINSSPLQPGDRRDRLKYVQEEIQHARGTDAVADMDSSSDEEEDEGEFYTEGSDDLLQARRKLARYSLSR